MKLTGPSPSPEGSYAGTPSISAPGGRGGALRVGQWIKWGEQKEPTEEWTDEWKKGRGTMREERMVSDGRKKG